MKKYQPCKLPEDYKSFLRISNGFLLQWQMKYDGEILPLGCMHLSSLSQVKPIETVEIILNYQNEKSIIREKSKFPIGFDIDSMCNNGKVVLMFENDLSKSSIWFQDLSYNWNFIADSFTSYYRLMLLHLGISTWQSAFTSNGLNHTTIVKCIYLLLYLFVTSYYLFYNNSNGYDFLRQRDWILISDIIHMDKDGLHLKLFIVKFYNTIFISFFLYIKKYK
ncbi:hypothetical protein RFI_28329 [Reticulomyxa filosa]|uniref:Knr4/Smi1-like domain-containing protein n=1 Tax=Reticulomyxa filosa TaxID=46433 RepID=X6M4Z6_RETFI|nr:hypothetical protein RFI_28329 [Reticulomyxa filosa]|eukprot:ETO09058.1 hypothetical protein RFI_28329 [Reticulomyxa filosa]